MGLPRTHQTIAPDVGATEAHECAWQVHLSRKMLARVWTGREPVVEPRGHVRTSLARVLSLLIRVPYRSRRRKTAPRDSRAGPYQRTNRDPGERLPDAGED